MRPEHGNGEFLATHDGPRPRKTLTHEGKAHPFGDAAFRLFKVARDQKVLSDDATPIMMVFDTDSRLNFGGAPSLHVLGGTYLLPTFLSTTPAFFLASAKAWGVCPSPSFWSD